MTTWEPYYISGGTHYHIGNYYNWAAAVAMSDSSRAYSERPDQSICPAGWRLPAYIDDKSFAELHYAEHFTVGANGTIQEDPAYFVYADLWYGEFGSVGSRGVYWGSGAYDSNYSYELYFTAGGYLQTMDKGNNNTGASIRCVAR